MNFEKAFDDLTAGKRIRRKRWEPLMHLHQQNKNIITYRGETTHLYEDANVILSTGWNVVGENKKLTFIEALTELKLKKHLTHENMFMTGSYIFIDNNQFAICKPVEYNFMPSFEDLCSTDWEVMK